jgi:hypothetical protein
MASAAPQPAGAPSFTSLDQLLSYNVRGQPRAVFTRLAMGGDRAKEGELGCFEMPLVHGAKLQLGRFDPETDGPGRKDKFVLSMADRRGISRSHGWLECNEGRFLIVWPVTEKEGFPTWVNGEPIKSSTSLRTGDWIGFGAMYGKPIVEFDCTIVNASPQKSSLNKSSPQKSSPQKSRMTKVSTPVAKPPAPGSVASVQTGNSMSTTPDTLRNGQSSRFNDYELSTDWTPETGNATAAGSDDELGTDQPSRLHRSHFNQSGVLERAQRQLAETKLELQQKEHAHEKELSARTRLSNEAAELRAAHQEELSARTRLSNEAVELRAAHQKELSARTSLSKEASQLRGEIATLRAFLAEQAADQVFLSPAARPATFSKPPSSAAASEPATFPKLPPSVPVPKLPPSVPASESASPRSPDLKGTTRSTTSAGSVVQDVTAATVVKAHARGTASRLAVAVDTDTDTDTVASSEPQEESKVRERFPREISQPKAALPGLSELLRDTQANFRRVSDALKQLPDTGGESSSTTTDTAGASDPGPWKKFAEIARSAKDGKKNRTGCLGFNL